MPSKRPDPRRPAALPAPPSARATRPSLREPALIMVSLLSSSIAAWALFERTGATPLPLPASPAAATAETLSGPWGTLGLRDITLDPRGEYLRPDMCTGEAPSWSLPGLDGSAVAQLYDAALLSRAHREALDGATRCAPGGCTARPPLEFVTGLSPAERAALYARIGRFEVNSAQFQPMRRRPGELTAMFRQAGASPGTLTLLQSLVYSDGRNEAFADLDALCARAPDAAERGRILTAVVRERGLIATLRVPSGADVDTLARWWSVGRQSRDLRALLGSLARAPGGGEIDVMELLPRFARGRLNTFPEPDEPRYDCAHAALSFFTPAGEARFLLPGEVKRAIEREYHPVAGNELRLGDVLIFTAPDGTLIHAVVHLAGDLVFSKNGVAFHKPWLLARRSQLESEYGFPSIYAYRRNTLLEVSSLPPSSLEQAEKLEQLRMLQSGGTILVAVVQHSASGIDTPADYAAFVARRQAG